MFRYTILILCLLSVVASASTVTLTGPIGTEISINGTPIGSLPLEPLDLPAGNNTLTATHPGSKTFVRKFSTGDQNDVVTVDILMEKLSRKDAVLFSLAFAGLGQRYQNKPILGWTLTAVEAGGLLMGLLSEMEMQNHNNDYLVAKSNYDSSVDEDDIIYWRDKTDTTYQLMSDSESLRNVSLGIAAGAVVVSLLDAAFRVPSFETKITNNSELAVQAGLTFNF